MPYFELINIHKDYQYSTVRLFKDYVEEIGKYRIALPLDSNAHAYPLNETEISEAAKSQNADFFIVGVLNRISEKVVITISLHRTSDENIIWKDKQKINHPDDLDLVFQKLAKALGTKKKKSSSDDIYSVTAEESKRLRKIKVMNSVGISLGSSIFLTNPFFDDPFSAGGGAFWFYDARTLLMELDAQYYFMGENSMMLGSIGVYKPIFPRNQTPFIGGGMGLTRIEALDNGNTYNESGTLAYIGGGYILNRLSNVGIRIHGKYFFGLFSMGNPDRNFPHGLMLNLEIYFAK